MKQPRDAPWPPTREGRKLTSSKRDHERLSQSRELETDRFGPSECCARKNVYVRHSIAAALFPRDSKHVGKPADSAEMPTGTEHTPPTRIEAIGKVLTIVTVRSRFRKEVANEQYASLDHEARRDL